MRHIALAVQELRTLSNQLQNFQAGYTVPQIRALDKVVRVMEEVVKEYVDKLKAIMSEPVAFSTQEEKMNLDKAKEEKAIKFIEEEGKKVVTADIEDSDFEFIKSVWSKMGSLNGSKETRETIIRIDDALVLADKESVFTKDKLPN